MGEEAEKSEEETSEGMTAARAAQVGLRQISELIDKETLGVTSVESAEDGWRVGVEVLEDRRVPSSTDMLALYELQLSEDGTLQGYSRKRRYSRGSSENRGQ
ncbi:gas vesicle protein [Glycomyces luteolus]|uniref:Gas vesicle protein n=1 Tax=Glycomyces luteolus TaxID=2670330 RepID=A0A9X3PC09_9ACTN|nr:gas vesicle protein GvpO [Glycomyces luteolus]MDA1360713.1 gas vesicle protein [Glycomyces luteolus]